MMNELWEYLGEICFIYLERLQQQHKLQMCNLLAHPICVVTETSHIYSTSKWIQHTWAINTWTKCELEKPSLSQTNHLAASVLITLQLPNSSSCLLFCLHAAWSGLSSFTLSFSAKKAHSFLWPWTLPIIVTYTNWT